MMDGRVSTPTKQRHSIGAHASPLRLEMLATPKKKTRLTQHQIDLIDLSWSPPKQLLHEEALLCAKQELHSTRVSLAVALREISMYREEKAHARGRPNARDGDREWGACGVEAGKSERFDVSSDRAGDRGSPCQTNEYTFQFEHSVIVALLIQRKATRNRLDALWSRQTKMAALSFAFTTWQDSKQQVQLARRKIHDVVSATWMRVRRKRSSQKFFALLQRHARNRLKARTRRRALDNQMRAW